MKHIRFRDLKRALQALGVVVSSSPGGSSHYHATLNGTTYPIPASHGDHTDVPYFYVRKACRALGLSERELRRELGLE